MWPHKIWQFRGGGKSYRRFTPQIAKYDLPQIVCTIYPPKITREDLPLESPSTIYPPLKSSNFEQNFKRTQHHALFHKGLFCERPKNTNRISKETFLLLLSLSKNDLNMYYVWLSLPFFCSYFNRSLRLRLTVALPSIQVTITCNIACTFISNWIVHSLQSIYWISWKLHCSGNVSSINVHFHYCLKFPALILPFVFPLTFTWHCWRPGSSLQLPGIYHTLIPPQTRQFIDPSNVTNADLWISDPLKT